MRFSDMEQIVNFWGGAILPAGVRWEEAIMKLISTWAASVAVIVAGAVSLAACGREADRAARPEADAAAPTYQRANYTPPSADRSGNQYSGSQSSGDRYSNDRSGDRRSSRTQTARDNSGWASNRRHSGADNAQYQFGKNGADFAAVSVDAYVARAHAFLQSPPRGVLKAARSNGDVLYYDPKANVFVVADKDGTPRTMFKPRDGMTYWTQQKQGLADGSGRRGGRTSGGDSGSAEG